jgi:hypothetical protein
MKKTLFTIAAMAAITFSSCYVRVGERHPHSAAVIIHTSDNIKKDSLQSPAVAGANPKDSLQAPVSTEPVK